MTQGRRRRFGFTIVSLALAMGGANAQVGTQMVPFPGIEFSIATNSLISGSIVRKAIQADRPAASPAPRSAPGSPAPTLRYRPDAAAEAAATSRMIDLLAQAAPQRRPQLERDIGAGQLQRAYRQLMRENGLDVADLGDVVAAYYLVTWQIAHDRVASAGEVAAARSQLASNLGSDPAVAALNERQRQETAADLSLLTMLAFASYHELKTRNDAAGLRQLQDTIVQAMRQQGLDLRALSLTSSGFVRR